jgi:DtxR family Mn-dependent transcriptional regulator
MTGERVATVPSHPDPEHTSESEEMYLITVARAVEAGAAGRVPVAVLAKDLQVSVASANEMVRKLASRGFITYEPYHGVELTANGALVAERVLRTRRLWALFLAEKLGFSPKDADDQACLLEHVTIPEATERLAEYLGDPTTGPLGHRIPRTGQAPSQPAAVRLTELNVGRRAEVVSIAAPEQVRAFLSAEGLVPGAGFVVAGFGSTGVLLELDAGMVNLAGETASLVEVREVGG